MRNSGETPRKLDLTPKFLGEPYFTTREKGYFALCDSEKEQLEIGLGTIILSDIDYKNGTAQVHIKPAKKDDRGKGYGADSLDALIEYAFKEMRLHCLYATVLSYNDASKRLFEKCGFNKEGMLRDRIYKKGEYVSVISYSLLRRE